MVELTPVIHSVSPNSGPQSHFTRIEISGDNLGDLLDDIDDIGLLISDGDIHSRLSCLGTARVLEANKRLECYISAIHSGYSKQHVPYVSGSRFDTDGGTVFVQTNKRFGKNDSVRFTFEPCNNE